MSNLSVAKSRLEQQNGLLGESAAGSLEAGLDDVKSAAAEAASKAKATLETAGEDAYTAGMELYASVERYIKENPVPVAIGVATAGALVAILLTSRQSTSRSMQRKWLKEFNRYSDDVRRTVRAEVRNLNANGGLSGLAGMLPEQDVKRFLAPWIEQAVRIVSGAKDSVEAAVKDKLA